MLEFDICFKDVDQEGNVINEVILSTSKELKGAMWIKGALAMSWASDETEGKPDREFFVQEREVEEEGTWIANDSGE